MQILSVGLRLSDSVPTRHCPKPATIQCRLGSPRVRPCRQSRSGRGERGRLLVQANVFLASRGPGLQSGSWDALVGAPIRLSDSPCYNLFPYLPRMSVEVSAPLDTLSNSRGTSLICCGVSMFPAVSGIAPLHYVPCCAVSVKQALPTTAAFPGQAKCRKEPQY